MGYWKFDENSGTSVTDSSGSGNGGTLSTSTGWVTGKSGSAVDFNSVGMTVNSSPSLQITGDMTISFVWKNLMDPAGQQGTPFKKIYKGPDAYSPKEFRFEFEAVNESFSYTPPAIQWAILGASNLAYDYWLTPGGTSLQQGNTWHLITIVKSSTGGLYEDRANLLNSGGTITGTASTDPFVIESFGLGASVIFDEMRIYNRALSTSEIQAIYDSLF